MKFNYFIKYVAFQSKLFAFYYFTAVLVMSNSVYYFVHGMREGLRWVDLYWLSVLKTILNKKLQLIEWWPD